MSGANALLSDVQARAERRRLQSRDERWHDLVQDAWRASRAATDPSEALRWLERAHRMLPHDGLIAARLAALRMGQGDFADAASLFEQVARQHEIAETWVGLAVCARVLQDGARARDAIERALHSGAPTADAGALASAIAGEHGLFGWCGLSPTGLLHAGPTRPEAVLLDEQPVRLRWSNQTARLPPGWPAAEQVRVLSGGRDWLGSPLPARRLGRLEAVVEAEAGGLSGWAWYPAEPGLRPMLTIRSGADAWTITAQEAAEGRDLGHPLARPWAFGIAAERLAPGPVSVLDAAGRHVLGSPLDPLFEPAPVWAGQRGGTPKPARTRPPVDVVIPVYRGLDRTLACIHSVLDTVPAGTRAIVVDDASPEPALSAALVALQQAGRIMLLQHVRNLGFPASANAGLRACAGRDAVLLNSDTLVPPGWLARLRAAAYAAPDIGSVTPLSNDATILSYPALEGGNAVPDLPQTAALDRLARSANGRTILDIPTGIGFCLYLRRDCLDQTGLLREDVFAQGYGEENDFCLRARHLGWRNVAAPGVFVGHVGGHSFGAGRNALLRRNLALLNRMHPGYDALIAAHVAADPLGPIRRAMDERRWAASRSGRAVVIVTHAGGGGVDRVVEARRAEAAASGLRAVVLRPVKARPGLCRIDDPAFPNLAYAIPAEMDALVALLAADRPVRAELHHRLGHAPEIMALLTRLEVPVDVFVHDYSSFCQRIALTGPTRRYCGEPDVQGCTDCIADLGTLFEEAISMPDLLARSAAELAGARRVIAPSIDAARRIQRHFPAVQPAITPWDDDAALPPIEPTPRSGVRRVCVVGAIGVEKGYEVLLACARDARDRRLPLHFTVVGYTQDDPRLLQAGPVWITGEYQDAEAAELIRAQRADLAFLPSVWPETWCFALSRAWEAGLGAMAFDVGAPAERIRATGRGWLLPLGLGAGGINDALLAAAPLAPGQPARHRNETIQPARTPARP